MTECELVDVQADTVCTENPGTLSPCYLPGTSELPRCSTVVDECATQGVLVLLRKRRAPLVGLRCLGKEGVLGQTP